MHLRLERAASELPADCEAVFRNSAIYERYFQDPGRLELSLRRAAAQGELYLAVSEDGELAGAMRVVMTGFCGLYPYLSLIGVRDTSGDRVWAASSWSIWRIWPCGPAPGGSR